MALTKKSGWNCCNFYDQIARKEEGFKIVQKMIKSAGKFLTTLLIAIGSCFPQLSAQEYVGGLLSENTVFSPALNPYIVVEPIIVPDGVTLTIEPGTILRFMISSSIKTEGGTLIARGLPALPVTLMAQTDKKWDGINFSVSKTIFDEDGNYLSGSILEYISINMTTTGLVLSDSALIFAQHLSITNSDFGVYLQSGSTLQLYNSTIDQCSFGMYIKNSGSNIIDNCSVTNCDIGIFFPSNNISRFNRFTNNNLSYHRNIALFMSIGQSSIQYNLIKGNTVAYNNIGLHIGNGGLNDQGFNVISSNIVQHNDIGIKLSQDKDTLRANLVESNITGVLLTKASSNYLINNIIQDNSEWGLTLTDGSFGNYISTNSFYNNQKGVKVTHKDFKYSTGNTFTLNLLYNNLNESFLFEAGPQQPLTRNSIISTLDSGVFVNHFESDIFAQDNWWGTTDTTRIDSMIYDFHDQESYGEVIYKPMLGSPDPQSPISRPKLVVKRLAGNRILVNWINNTEPDLAGYKVYYGGAGSGGFTGFIDVGADTTCILDNLLLSDPVAVTAYDNDADGYSDQPEGHESAFSYAIAGPYAGEDSTVCQGESFILNAATSLFGQNLQWATSGDGMFSNPALLNSVYSPGQNDILTGTVILTLSQFAEGLVLTDEMELRISGLPFVFAGNDTTITRQNDYSTITANAINYTGIYWITSGDGVFADPNELITEYQPGTNDILTGAVHLILELQSGCGNLSDTLLLGIIPSFNISGKVHRGEVLVPDAVVVAIKAGIAGPKAVSTQNTMPDGTFNFTNLTIGEYYLYALNDPQTYPDWAPTYYAGNYQWQKAYLLPLDTDVYDVDINLMPLSNHLPAGTGSISGFYNYVGKSGDDDSIYNKPWFPDGFYQSGQNAGIPAANHVVLLMNTELNRIFYWALTASDGSFHFDQLPFGSYRLWGEKAGYVNSLSPAITLSQANNGVEGVQLVVTQKHIEITLPSNEIPVKTDIFLYPNPGNDKVWINPQLASPDDAVELCFYTTDGKLVRRYKTSQGLPNGTGLIDISGFRAGLYLVTLSIGNQFHSTMKLSVIH
jgi:parallel beta-helix repeat protein